MREYQLTNVQLEETIANTFAQSWPVHQDPSTSCRPAYVVPHNVFDHEAIKLQELMRSNTALAEKLDRLKSREEHYKVTLDIVGRQVETKIR